VTSVHLKDNESQQQLLSRFRKKVIRSKILSEVRKRRWFISKNEQRRIDEKKAARRYQQKRRRTEYYPDSTSPNQWKRKD